MYRSRSSLREGQNITKSRSGEPAKSRRDLLTVSIEWLDGHHARRGYLLDIGTVPDPGRLIECHSFSVTGNAAVAQRSIFEPEETTFDPSELSSKRVEVYRLWRTRG